MSVICLSASQQVGHEAVSGGPRRSSWHVHVWRHCFFCHNSIFIIPLVIPHSWLHKTNWNKSELRTLKGWKALILVLVLYYYIIVLVLY